MKVSIITPTFNSVETLQYNLASVARQSFPNIEHIIIDNQSVDGTIELAEKFTHIHQIISEKDNGIYDAMNKGIALATGDIIGILNSDDYLADADVITVIVEEFKKSNCDAVYGNLVYVLKDKPYQIQRVWIAGGFKRNLFYYGWMLPHPTFYVKKEIYQKYGNYNTSFKYAADYEMILRLLLKYSIKVTAIRKVMVYMRTGGATNKNISRRLNVNKEDQLAWKSVGFQPKWFTLYLKPIRKIGQFVFHYFSVRWLVNIPPSQNKESFINEPKAPVKLIYSSISEKV